MPYFICLVLSISVSCSLPFWPQALILALAYRDANILVCIIYAQKIKRTHSFCQSASLGLAGNTQKSLWSSLHALCAAILWLGSCLYKIVYSILFPLKHWGNLKVIQIGGMIPRWRNAKQKAEKQILLFERPQKDAWQFM